MMLHAHKADVTMAVAKLSVGFSIQDEVMDIARPVPKDSHYPVDGIYLQL